MQIRAIINVDFREFDRAVFEKSWIWLNDAELKGLMLTSETDQESREKWFRGLNNRDDYFLRSVWKGEEPIGVVGLKNITSSDAELFMYIGEKKYWGKAIGLQMTHYMLDYARNAGMNSIYTKILKSNRNSLRLAKRLGFVQEKVLKDEKGICMRKQL